MVAKSELQFPQGLNPLRTRTFLGTTKVGP